jgi:hypothetical protein
MPPEAESISEYGVLTMPFESSVVVTIRLDVCEAVTEMVRLLFATWGVGTVESTTCIVKLEVPWAVGVPVMIPAVERLRPNGSAPEGIVHEYGSVPPEAESVAKYSAPTAPLGNAVVTIVKVGVGVGLDTSSSDSTSSPTANGPPKRYPCVSVDAALDK